MTGKHSVLLAGVSLILCLAIAVSCGSSKKLSAVRSGQMNAKLVLPSGRQVPRQFSNVSKIERDTIRVNIEGREMIVMKAVRDDETGEMVASEEITAAVVSARFRNVAERHGKVNIEFQVIVPKEMQDSKWQLRFYPDMFMMDDSLRLDHIIITGKEYRRAQLRGYEQYARFLSKIVSDSTRFIDSRNLEIWISRNLPDLYAFKQDSSLVSDEVFQSYFGVSEQQAVDHYTNHFAKRLNNRRKMMRGKMYRKYVKSPIVTDHIRLDTVMMNSNGDFVYNYVQTVHTRPKLRKIDIVLRGEIYEQDRLVYTIPKTDPLSFYISSLSSFVDGTERYKTKIIERRAEAKAAWYIDFKVGKADIDENFGNNRENITFIRENLHSLLTDEEFVVDSILIAASASPEGTESANIALSSRRAASTAEFFRKYVRSVQDSLRKDGGISISMERGKEQVSVSKVKDIPFRSRSGGENWSYLDEIVAMDELMSDEEKANYYALRDIANKDSRERMMSKASYYRHLRNDVYPRLRTVLFSFNLHRRGMVKDTVHTTELDTTYMKGIWAINDRDYETAAALLSPYNDYNTAIAYVCLDRNYSALSILEGLEQTANVNYMLAVVYSRLGDEVKAVEKYLLACHQEPSYVHRGNLDPEIIYLITKYQLNGDDDDGLGL